MTRREWVEWLVWMSSAGAAARGDERPADPRPEKPAKPIPALRWFHTVADDFVVDIWHNGALVPDSCRELAEEVFGATVEKVTREVFPGDWLVFHVVNNRLRWGGAKYFGFVGFATAGDPTLVSEAESGRWTCCEAPANVAAFIAHPTSRFDRLAKPIATPWDGGAPRMDGIAGGKWTGTPIWGPSARSVWLKLRVPA